MIAALVWVEALLAGLLLAALMMGVGLRRRRRVAAAVLCGAGIVVPALVFGAMVAITATIRWLAGFGTLALWLSVALFVVYLAGTIVIGMRAKRRMGGGVREGERWPVRRLGGTCIFLGALLAMTWWNLELRAGLKIQSLRTQVGTEALAVMPRAVADAENAAPLYEQAEAALKADVPEEARQIANDFVDPKSAEATAFLGHAQAALALFRRAADKAGCRFPGDGIQPNLESVITHLEALRHGAMLIALAARREAAEGHAASALTDVARIGRIGQHAATSPLLIGDLTSIAIDALASDTLAQVLPQARQVSALDAIGPMDPTVPGALLARALRGEEVYGLASFCDAASGSGPRDTAMGGLGAMSMYLWLEEDIALYRENMRALQRLAPLPFYQTESERRQIAERLQPGHRRGFLTAIRVPSMLRCFQLVANAEALRACGEAAVAATRYRLDHGDMPATVDQLIPHYLTKAPLDPYTGQPLHWHKDAKGLVTIYSVGQDGKDNGGLVTSAKGRTPDVGITLAVPPVAATQHR